MPSAHSYVELLEANHWIRKVSDAWYWQCTTRTVQESKLFPVNAYISLSYYNAWYRYPGLLRKIDEAMPAEEIGDRAREVSSYVNLLTTGLISQFYLAARQLQIDMGLLRPTDAIDDVLFVMDFSRRLNLSYHRNHGHMLATDANNRAQILPERTVQVFHADAIGTKPGDKLHRAVTAFQSAASSYAFLKNAECRLGLHNSGPYRIAASTEMLVRDFIDLAECDLPWLDGIAADMDHNNLTMPVIMKDTHFNIVDDWGSFEAEPNYNQNNMVAVGLYTSDYLSDGYLPVHMDSAGELADYLEHVLDLMVAATNRLWRVMAAWSRDQMIDAGLLVYSSVPRDLAHFAGVYAQDDWFSIEERAQRFRPLHNDEYGGSAIAELVGLVSLTSQQGSEYHMSKWANAPGEMFSPIPYSVLNDDQFTPTVGPIREGSCTLAPKISTWTTTRGRLTQDQCNQAARAFTPSYIDKGSRYLDDSWVKHHAGDPRAQELYAATQAHSSSLAGKGAGLRRADIEALRRP